MKRSLRQILYCVFGAAAAASSLVSQGAAAERPNILFAISDDQSWAHAGAYGDEACRTPAFDRVAREGVRFNYAYTAAPSCTPSRSAILTGQAIWRLEQGGLLFGALPAKFDVFPRMLEDAGYVIGNTGKTWGPGNLEAGGWKRHPMGKAYRKRRLDQRKPGMSSLDYAANFADFLADRPEQKPFCFWYGSSEPHRSYRQGQGKAAGKKLADAQVFGCLPDVPLVRSDVLDYYVEIEHFDEHLARMLDMLQEAGELDNTLVIVTGDHGMPFPRCKGNLYDSGTRVPLAIRLPGTIPGGAVVDDFVSLTDVAPTILDAAGLDVPQAMTGRSLLPLMKTGRSGRVEKERDFVVTAFERHTWCRPDGVGYPMRAIRTHEFMYIRNDAPDRWPAGGPDFPSPHQGSYGDIDRSPTKTYMIEHRDDPGVAKLFELGFGKRPGEELYDMREDPDQLHNLADDPEHAETKQRLRKRLEAYLRATGDPRMEGKNPWDGYAYWYGDYWKRAKSEQPK